MKLLHGVLSISLLALVGCAEGMERIQATSDPIVKVSSDLNGAQGKDILNIRAPIAKQKIQSGECWDYQVSGLSGKRLPYYVVVKTNGVVGYHGFKTCNQAINEGVFQ